MVKKILFMLLLFLPIVYALDYYADVTIDVDNLGFVTIEGTTNYPDLLVKDTAKYTSKKQSYWLLNITKEEEFSDYVYSLSLPASASINYVKSADPFRIENEFGKLVIRGFGQNKPFSVIVQYQLEKPSKNIIGIISVILIFVIVFLIIKKIIKKKAKKEINEKFKKIKKEDPKYDLSNLTTRQKKIMKLLIEKNKALTQAQIQQELKLPKASLSRNIRALELKGFVEKEKVGMSNMIKLKK